MGNDNENLPQGASYPYVALQTALVLSDAVKQLGGNKTPIPKSLLASTLKEDEKSQGFAFRIASAKCYGLIEGRAGFTLTEAARRYYYPTSERDKTDAALSFLASPSGFSEIIKRFDGQALPDQQMLANIFHTQLRVPESWSLRAASFFSRAAQLVGALDERGFLRYDAARHTTSSLPQEGRVPDGAASPKNDSVPIASHTGSHHEAKAQEGYHTYTLPLANGRKVTVSAPLDITQQEIKRLNKWAEFTLQVDWSGDAKKEETP